MIRRRWATFPAVVALAGGSSLPAAAQDAPPGYVRIGGLRGLPQPDPDAVVRVRAQAPQPTPTPGPPSGTGTPPPLNLPMPTTPGQPGQPGQQTPGQQTPQTPNQNPNQSNQNLANEASARGTGAESTAFPGVFGDLFAGSGIAGPLPVQLTPNGLPARPVPVIRQGTNERILVGGLAGGPPQPLNPPVDDLLRAPAPQVLGTPPRGAPAGTPTTPGGFLPPEGTVFDPSLAGLVARVPVFVRGAFKVTENDSPRPTTRAYFTYNFYDNVFQSFGGPGVPRAMLHQQVFGMEFADPDRQFSVGVRLPYNQFVADDFFADTSLGDLTVIGKVVLAEDRETGSLLSAGLAVTAPTGSLPFASTITGQNIRGSLIQPWTGYILARGDYFAQGFNAIVVPTDSDEVTFFTFDVAAGFFALRNPGATLSSVAPVLECHTNVPLNHVGTQSEPVGFVTNVTLLAGTHLTFQDNVTVGFATGAPVTGPRPFSLQATFQLNWRY